MMNTVRNLTLGLASGALAAAGFGVAEATYLGLTGGAPDLLAPLYAVVLYGTIGAGFGFFAGAALCLFEQVKEVDEGVAWSVGAIGAIVPIGLFVLRYLANKVIFAEQGVPLVGMAGILVVLALVSAVIVAKGRFVRKDRALAALARPGGAVGALGALVTCTALVAMAPVSGDPRADFKVATPLPDALADKPNVVFILVDTLRADYLGTYGFDETDVSPAIDAFAADSVVFERAFTQASWTRASGASLFSSRMPSGHNAATKAARLAPEVTLFSEPLQAAGVRTGALINNINMTSTFGFNQGFDVFVYESPAYPLLASESVFGLTLYKVVHKLNERLFSKHKAVESFYQPANVVLDDAQRFMKANADGRFALYVHLMEPHDPYFEHPVIDGSGPADYNGVGFARAEHEHPDASPEHVAYLKRVYRDEITFMDRQLAAFFTWMKSEGLYDNTLIIFTSDHGEEFYEHGGFWHGTTLYDEQLHVPLIMKLPRQAFAGTRAPFTVRGLDVAPTITAALGLPPDPSWEGRELIGQVMRWAEAEQQAAAAPVDDAPDGEVSVAPPVDPCAAYTHAFDLPVAAEEDFEGNVLTALRRGGFKYLTANAGNPRGLPEVELFDVIADLGEQRNLAGSDSGICGQYPADIAKAHAAELALVIERAKSTAVDGGEVDMSCAEVEQLIALGYMDAAGKPERCQ